MAEDFLPDIGHDPLAGPVREEQQTVSQRALDGHNSEIEQGKGPETFEAGRDDVAVDGDLDEVGADDLEA